MHRWMWPIVLIGLWPVSAGAQDRWEQAVWRASFSIEETWGTNTYRVWIPPGAYDRSAKKYVSWHDTQHYGRFMIFDCAPGAWGADEISRAQLAALTKNQSYVPLAKYIFVPVNIAVDGPMPTTGRPSWRLSARDSLMLVLRDGRTLWSMLAPEVPSPSPSLARPTSDRLKTCRHTKLLLEGKLLWRTDELRFIAERQPEWYWDKPTANAFIVPVPNSGRDFHLKDVVAASVTFRGRRIELERNVALSMRPR